MDSKSLIQKNCCLAICCLFSLVTFIGCGGGKNANVATVAGRVTYQGKPLDHATITFVPDKGRPAHSKTDMNGNYSLIVSLGKCRVEIVATNEHELPEVELPPDRGGVVHEVKSRIPKKYAMYEKSGVSFEVKSEGENSFDIPIK